MNEFLKLNWDSTSNSSYLEKQACSFISDDVLMDSYIYQHLKKRITTQKKLLVLNKEKELNIVPGKKYMPSFQRMSILDKEQQEHCFNAMKILIHNKSQLHLKPEEAYSLQVFERMSSKLAIENEAFVAYVKNFWENDKLVIEKLQNNLHRYGWVCYRKKFQRYLNYGDYYKELSLISMTYNEEKNSTVEVNCLQNLLELGTLARFSQPTLKIECRLRGNSLPTTAAEIQSNSKLPVSKDQNIKDLLKDNEFDIVISSSGLKRLLDNTDLKANWIVPVKIEMSTKNKEGKKFSKKVVFIDKPLPQKHPDPLDMKYYSMKRLIKTNFCQYEAFRFEKQDSYPDETSNKKLSEEEDKINSVEFNKTKMNLPELPEEADNLEEGELLLKDKSNGKCHHNANYKLWKFKKIVNDSALMKNQEKGTELNVLIRSKLDACEASSFGTLQPVIVKPKIELQLEYGANVPTKSELSREWTSLFFRPYSTLYRVRMHWNTAEVVSIENCNIQKVVSEANSLYQYNQNLGLGMLNNLFNKLVELKCGNYMLVHIPKYEHFVAVWKECEGLTTNGLSMKSEFKNCAFKTEINKNWIPIDLNYILPIHEFERRPPGCFPARNHTKKKKKGKGRKWKKNFGVPQVIGVEKTVLNK